MNLTLRSFLPALLFAATCLGTIGNPNLVVFISDDLGVLHHAHPQSQVRPAPGRGPHVAALVSASIGTWFSLQGDRALTRSRAGERSRYQALWHAAPSGTAGPNCSSRTTDSDGSAL